MKSKTRIEREQILALTPCDRAVTQYDAQISQGYNSWIDCLKDESIEPLDRIWVGIRALPDDRQKRLFACWCAEQALNQIHPSKWDERSLNAIKVARDFANGKVNTLELQTARRAAASAAAASAAYAAAYAAAAAAATYAAYAADAAYAAAYDAAAAAARHKMHRHTLKKLITTHKRIARDEK